MAEEYLASFDEETGHDVMDTHDPGLAHGCQSHTSARRRSGDEAIHQDGVATDGHLLGNNDYWRTHTTDA
jgi:hypothetical protein